MGSGSEKTGLGGMNRAPGEAKCGPGARKEGPGAARCGPGERTGRGARGRGLREWQSGVRTPPGKVQMRGSERRGKGSELRVR
jgi:hypothetical protein